MAEEQNGNGQYKLGVEHRLTKLEGTLDGFGKTLMEVKNNHLVHLQEAVDKIQKKMWYGLWFVVVTLVGVVIDLALRISAIK